MSVRLIWIPSDPYIGCRADKTTVSVTPGWSPRANQQWTALFQRFHKFKRWSALFQNGLRKPALIGSESALFRKKNQRWFSADFEPWNLGFSALFRAESALFRDFQEMNSAETDLKFSELELFSVECLWDVNPGRLAGFCWNYSKKTSEETTFFWRLIQLGCLYIQFSTEFVYQWAGFVKEKHGLVPLKILFRLVPKQCFNNSF